MLPGPHRRRKPILWLTGLVAATVAVWFLSALPRDEPSFGGRGLRGWLRQLTGPHPITERNEARQAIRQIGTNALPALLEMLGHRDHAWVQAFRNWARERELPLFKHAPGPDTAGLATAGFSALDELALPAAPQLAAWLDNPDDVLRFRAWTVLAGMGPGVRPALDEVVKHGTPRARGAATGILSAFPPPP